MSVRKIYPFRALETKKGVINKLNVFMRQIEITIHAKKRKSFKLLSVKLFKICPAANTTLGF